MSWIPGEQIIVQGKETAAQRNQFAVTVNMNNFGGKDTLFTA
jgi:hypothetical protein